MLQTSTETPWPLQRCCKRQPKLRGLCNGVANVNRNSVAFATVLQTSTETPWPLQRWCKRQPKLRGFCNGVANVNRNSVAFATVLQTSTETPWLLQRCCKRQPIGCWGVCDSSLHLPGGNRRHFSALDRKSGGSRKVLLRRRAKGARGCSKKGKKGGDSDK